MQRYYPPKAGSSCTSNFSFFLVVALENGSNAIVVLWYVCDCRIVGWLVVLDGWIVQDKTQSVSAYSLPLTCHDCYASSSSWSSSLPLSAIIKLATPALCLFFVGSSDKVTIHSSPSDQQVEQLSLSCSLGWMVQKGWRWRRQYDHVTLIKWHHHHCLRTAAPVVPMLLGNEQQQQQCVGSGTLLLVFMETSWIRPCFDVCV